MTRHLDPDFDQRISDWFEEDPTIAPREVLGTVLAAYPSIPQRRTWRAPWRLPTMNPATRLAGAAVVLLLVVGGAALFLRPATNVGPPPSSPGPSPTTVAPSSAVPAGSPVAVAPGPSGFDQVHVSDLYGYGMRYPAGWTFKAGAYLNRKDYTPALSEDLADFYNDPTSGHGVMVTSGPVGASSDLATWATFVNGAVASSFGTYLGGLDTCTRPTRSLIVGGEPATEVDFICKGGTWLYVAVIHRGYAYQIAWLDDGGLTAPSLRELFDQFLLSFTFTR